MQIYIRKSIWIEMKSDDDYNNFLEQDSFALRDYSVVYIKRPYSDSSNDFRVAMTDNVRKTALIETFTKDY